MTDDEATKVLDDAAAALGEHFEAVIIIASRPFPANERLTQIVHRGRGNWYAQRGMMREVMENDQARTVAHHVREQLKDSDDER